MDQEDDPLAASGLPGLGVEARHREMTGCVRLDSAEGRSRPRTEQALLHRQVQGIPHPTLLPGPGDPAGETPWRHR